MKYAAGVILYNPTQEQIDRICKLEESFDAIFLFDNSEPTYQKPSYPHHIKFHLLGEDANKGLSYAFNKIIKLCGEYDYLCTLDQDSIYTKEEICKLRTYLDKMPISSKIGIVAPFIDYGTKPYTPSEEADHVDFVITSGSFVNLTMIRERNITFDENYFIDRVDADLCKQVKAMGYEIKIYHESVLHQRLGEETPHSRSSHNPLRHYYMFRNRLYFNNKWYRGPKKWFLNITQIIKHLYIILFYETERPKKLKAFIEATKDYMVGRMGKRSTTDDKS